MVSVAKPAFWKAKIFMRPDTALSALEGFHTVFVKQTTKDTFLNAVTGRMKLPMATELSFSEEDGTVLSTDDFVASCADYTLTGSHDLTPESVEYDDVGKQAHVRLCVGVLARQNGALSRECHRWQ